MGKNKGTQPGALKKTIEEVKGSWSGFRKEMIGHYNQLAGKFNKVGEELVAQKQRFDKIVVATGQQLASLNAGVRMHTQVMETMDIYTQTLARMNLEVFARFEQLDKFLQKAGVEFSDLTPAELESIKADGKSSFELTWQSCLEQVQEERKAAIEEQRKKAEEAQKAAEEEAKKAKDEEEQASAEAELKEAEDKRSLVQEPGGEGAEVPEGAEVFGG